MIGWLIDTNVISEWRKPRPDRRVVEFLIHERRPMLHTSVVCLMEIRIGIENLANKAAAASLSNWLENVLGSYFEDRILPLGEDVLVDALKLATRAHRKRRGAPLADVLIAATARVHDLTVVTRNTRDFMGLEVPLLNVWTGKAFEGT